LTADHPHVVDEKSPSDASVQAPEHTLLASPPLAQLHPSALGAIGPSKKKAVPCRSGQPPFVVRVTRQKAARRKPMQYLLLIYTNETQDQAMSEAEQMEVFGGYRKVTEDMQAAGVLRAGDALQPTSTATTLRVRNGETITTDGPFAETTEQLGGYYLLECENLDDALGWAKKLPSAKMGSIEVRPIMVFE
jgi:hypothetical protein